MQIDQIPNILQFLIEIEQLKGIHRKTRPIGLSRFENSAEHSWHICLVALMCQPFATESLEMLRVLKMLLIHDLGEIDAGDVIIYATQQDPTLKAREWQGIQRLLNHLPPFLADEYAALWQEFEEGQTAESRYARAIDRIAPVLQNLHGELHSWRTHNISLQQVLSVNAVIAQGSPAIWLVLEQQIRTAFAGE